MTRAAFNIARNTFRECLREPIFIILHLSSLSIIGTYPGFALFVFREQEKLVTDGALATTLLFGWISAVLCATHAISREIEGGTVSLVLAKPVNRGLFLTAKTLGILGVLALFMWTNGLATLMALRIARDQFRLEWMVFSLFFGGIAIACLYGAVRNYVAKVSFPAVANQSLAVIFTIIAIVTFFLPKRGSGGYQWGQHIGLSAELAGALVLIGFAVWAMGALAVALSTWLDLTSNLTVCAVVFVVGLISDYAHQKVIDLTAAEMIQAMHFWIFALLPCLLLFWFLAHCHFRQRRCPAVRGWMVHLAFAAPFATLITKAVHNTLTQRYLDEPTLLMKLAGAALHPIKQGVARLTYAAIPNWQLFWMADALAAKRTVPVAYYAFGALYVSFFIVLFIVLGIVMFSWREVGSQSSQ